MSRLDVSILNEVIENVAYILDTLMAYRNIVQTGKDCNTCRAVNNCRYVPKPGQQVRYNCPHHVGLLEDAHGESK